MKRKPGIILATAAAVLFGATAWGSIGTARADDFELAMVIKSTTNPYYNATLRAREIAAEEIGGTAKNYGPTQSSGQAQVDIINNLADRHVPAIAVAPSDPDAVVPAMKRAQQLGAKVITFDADSGVDGAAVLRQPGDQRFGRPLRRRSCSSRPWAATKGKVAIVSAQPTAANQNAWIEAFKDEMPKYPDIEIVDEVYGYDNEQKAFDATVALTTKYPDLAGIYAPTCPGLPAVARALESVGKGKGKIKVAGNVRAEHHLRVHARTARSRASISGIRSSSATSPTTPPSYLAEGKIEGKPGDSFTIEAGKWPGTYTIDETGQIITGEPLQYTEANYKEYDLLALGRGKRGAAAPARAALRAVRRQNGGGACRLTDPRLGWRGVPCHRASRDHQALRARRGAERCRSQLCTPGGCMRSPARTAPARARSSRSSAASISPTAAAS